MKPPSQEHPSKQAAIRQKGQGCWRERQPTGVPQQKSSEKYDSARQKERFQNFLDPRKQGNAPSQAVVFWIISPRRALRNCQTGFETLPDKTGIPFPG